MKGIALGALSVAAVAIASLPASAADPRMPVKEPMTAASTHRWTGFYAGGHAGYGWGRQDAVFADPAPGAFGFPPGFGVYGVSVGNVDGFLGGVHVGYNWQLAPSWLVGIEGDFSFSGLNASGRRQVLPNPVVVPSSFATASTDINWLASIRARFGYATSSTLFYATGGIAWADIDYAANSGCSLDAVCNAPLHAPARIADQATGWVVGAGLDHRVWGNWMLGLEYLYYRFDGATAAGVPRDIATGTPFSFGCVIGAACVNYNFNDFDIHSIRARLSYKF